MKVELARAALLAAAALVSCSKGGSGASGTGAGGGDAGPSGPTTLAVTWTLAGAAASASTCMTQGAQQIAVTLSGTIDPSLHQSTTVDCSKGSVSFDGLLVQDLGTPYLEGTLLDAMGKSVATVGVDVVPTLGTTKATLAFFAPQGTGGATASSSTAASTSAAASTAASSAGGTGGSASSSSSTTSGGGGAGGGDGGA